MAPAPALAPGSPALTAAPPSTAPPDLAVIPEQPGPPSSPATGRLRRRPSGEPPPLPRQINTSGKGWLAASVTVLALGVLAAATSSSAGTAVTVADDRVLELLARSRWPELTAVTRRVALVASAPALHAVWLAVVAVVLATKRWRHLFVGLAALLTAKGLGAAVEAVAQRPRTAAVEVLGSWSGFAMPARPVLVLCVVLVTALYSLVPQGRRRQQGKTLAVGVVAAAVLARLHLAVDRPTDAAVAVVIGVTVPLLAFRLLVPHDVFPISYARRRTAHVVITGDRHRAVCRALADQLGVTPVDVAPFALEGSGGSTPLRVTLADGRHLFAKLFTATHVRSDRWYKLGRTLLYGGLEDERAFNGVRRLVQHEDYTLRLLQAAGLPVPAPHGVVEITPEREYLLVMEFVDGARELGDPSAALDPALVDEGLAIVRRLWEAGLAHRDIKPANLLVRDGRLLLIDAGFVEVRPSPWRQAVDLANMMLVLALRSDPTTVYERALRQFSVDEVAEAFAATRGLTMPTQLRRLIRAQGRDLHGEFLRLLPYRVRPIAIQRWSLRRVGLSVAVAVLAAATAAAAQSLVVRGPL